MSDDTPSVKRPVERKRVQMAVTLVIAGDEAEYVGTTVDRSSCGLRLQSDAVLSPGQPVGLLLAANADCFIKARVVWVGKSDSAQASQAGFQFLNLLPAPVC